MAQLTVKVEWRFVSTTPMVASVPTSGTRWMPKLSVGSWDSSEMVGTHNGIILTNMLQSSELSTGSQPSRFENAGVEIFLGTLNCDGTEAKLIDCSSSADTGCGNNELVGARCEGNMKC